MKVFIALFSLIAAALAAPMQLPAGVSAAACPNYPNCFIGQAPGAPNLAVPGAGFQYAAEQRILQQQFALAQPLAADVPGFGAHQAAEALVLAAQGRVPGSIIHSGQEAKVRQAEADLIALQQQQTAAFATAQPAFTGLVGASGVIGPSGLVGPSGPLAF